MKLDTPPTRRWARRVGRVAPLLTLAILVASPAVIARPALSVDDAARLQGIAAAIDSVPQRMGTWVGVDVPIPTDATAILQPNALLSREYSEIGVSRDALGTRVTLAIIHCRDVRHMDGHYPPVCYPQSGWTVCEVEKHDSQSGAVSKVTSELVKVRAGTTDFPFARCRFTRAAEGGTPRLMTVLYAFVLPDGRIETDIKALGVTSTNRADSARGVAQFQFVFQSDVSAARCAEVATSLMNEIPTTLFTQLGVRPTERTDAHKEMR